MTKKHFISLADSIRIYNRFASEPFTERQISELADFCKEQNGNFNRERWLGYIAGENGKNGGTIKPAREYQPKTGVKCGCKPGIQRDNCSTCEATGWVIDFKAIRAS